MNALRYTAALLVHGVWFFGVVVHTGSYLRSLVVITDDEVDVAVIDCVTLAFVAGHRLDLVAGPWQIGPTRHIASLPSIAVHWADGVLVKQVRKVMCEALHDDASLRSRFRLEDIVSTTMAYHRSIVVMAREARTRGYGELS